MVITAVSMYCFGLRYRENVEGTVQFFGVGNFHALSKVAKMIAESHYSYLDGPAERPERSGEQGRVGVESGVRRSQRG